MHYNKHCPSKMGESLRENKIQNSHRTLFTQGWCLLDRDWILQPRYLGGLYYLLGGNVDLQIRFRVLS